MLSFLGEFGRLGVTAVGNSPEEADEYYQRTVAALDEAARAAMGRDAGMHPRWQNRRSRWYDQAATTGGA